MQGLGFIPGNHGHFNDAVNSPPSGGLAACRTFVLRVRPGNAVGPSFPAVVLCSRLAVLGSASLSFQVSGIVQHLAPDSRDCARSE